MTYYISRKDDLESIVERALTPDYAFFRVGELSKAPGSFGSVFVAWSWDGGKKRIRAFGQAGTSRWAKPCTSKASEKRGSHYECVGCGGLGIIEDRP